MSTYKEDYRDFSLPETVRLSLLALEAHSPKLVFDSRAQAVRLLMRARTLGERSAKEYGEQLLREGLVSIEMPKDDLQPRLLEFVFAEVPQVQQVPPRLTKVK
jgi:hypothetical protein